MSELRTPPKQSLEFQMDGNQRVALAVLSTERERFAIAAAPPVIIPIPFHSMKEAVAQILAYEVEVALAKLPGGNKTPPHRWPKGMQGAKRASELLMDAAQLESAGLAVVEDQAPHFEANLNAVLGSDR